MTEDVIHPQLGPGKLIKTYMGGFEWEVLFESGRRFRLPAREFAQESLSAWQKQTEPIATPTYTERPATLETDQFRARQTLEALRLGIVPVQDVETFTIGLEAERVSLERSLARSRERGGDVMAVIGDYGFGKSHFIELSARRALREQCLVAVASLDLLEVPPSKPHEIYHTLIKSLRYPDTYEHGLYPLIQKALDTLGIVSAFAKQSPERVKCPLARALLALEDCGSQLAYDDMVQWVSGQKKPTPEMRLCIKKPPRLYRTGPTARQYVYILTSISVLATMLGYGGLAVLIDESEHYSLLRSKQRDKADAFFKAMIYASVSDTTSKRINPDSIPVHPALPYDISFAPNPRMFFLFALTESESKLPVDSWLSPSQIVRLDDRFIERDIREFTSTLLHYHCIAYGYGYPPQPERYGPVADVAPGLLARALTLHRINLREVIRLAVTIYDLLYLHEGYEYATLLEELRRGLRL